MLVDRTYMRRCPESRFARIAKKIASKERRKYCADIEKKINSVELKGVKKKEIL